ncbi:DoxX family protein [Aeoliella sp.]|uniref:DoxX family protein n=1 Tax=Aeoliella sp. TaxID=2795800 RepID=UPI003CCBAC7C
MPDESPPATIHNKGLPWTGRFLSGSVAAAFLISGVGKLVGGEQLQEEFEHLGLSLDFRFPLAVLEVICAVIYAIPATCILGAILLTGYMGGAICTHWSAGDPFYIQIAVGVLVWLGVYVREPRLWSLLPIRR